MSIAPTFSRWVRAWNTQIRRNLFTAEILRTTTRARGRSVPFGVTLTLGDRRAEVAVTHLTDPGTAHAEVAALLRRTADHLDPAVPGGAQGDGTHPTTDGSSR
ncbi:hypothetical protein NE857_21465 [Nocardiopsis exhalans]|uniref:Uncharacterized protein n=1 Tax=Nocardiopsis exhalans TaxID=163604 RepID=A0ABY5D2B0_9ACTN|nr:hypothetical protein [Nocardiopsis exhalans]USY17886.1 hypothetical protein NE857_21465 [Nocardiopsis exhalans]